MGSEVRLFDQYTGEPTRVQHVRASITGDIFVGYSPEALPPLHSRVRVTLEADVTGFKLIERGDPPEWIAVAVTKIDPDRSAAFEVLSKAEPQGPLDEAVERFADTIPEDTTVTVEGGGQKATLHGKRSRS